MFLAVPGTMGPLVLLQDAMRERHEQDREAIAKRIAFRKANGAGPDERTDFAKVTAAALALVKAAEGGESALVRTIAIDVLEKTAPALAPLPEFEPVEAVEGMAVRFRILSESRRRLLQAELDAANAATAAHPVGSPEWVRLDEAALAIVRTLLSETVAELHYDSALGTRVVAKEIDHGLFEALRHADAMLPLYRCAIAFQDLPPKKALRFGLPPQSTLKSATATDAGQPESVPSAAGVAQSTQMEPGDTSPAQSTRQTAAPVDTSSTTPMSWALSTSPGQSVIDLGSMALIG